MTTNQLLMSGKKGLVMGLANDKSIAWGICQALNAQGAQLAISYQNEVLEKRVAPLAAQLDNEPLLKLYDFFLGIMKLHSKYFFFCQ